MSDRTNRSASVLSRSNRKTRIIALAASAALFAGSSQAADIFKTNDANALNLNTAWVDGANAAALPGSSDIAVWDSRIAGPVTNALGANLAWAGIRANNNVGAATINGANTLTLGLSGIDMTGTGGDFTYAAVTGTANARRGLTLASGVQQWNVGAGRTLTMEVVPTRNNGTNNTTVGGILQIGTLGTVKFNNYFGSASNAITINAASAIPATSILQDGGNNPFVTYGDSDWATINSSGVVIPVTYTGTSGAPTAGTNVNVLGDYTSATVDVLSVRFADTLPYRVTTTGTHTVRGILVAPGSAAGTFTGGTIRPARNSTAGMTMSIIQNSTVGDLYIESGIGNASTSTTTAIAKAGPGKVVFAGTNGYSGILFIHDGTIQVGNGGATGQLGGTAAVVNNAALVINRDSSATLTIANAISGTGSLTQTGPGTTVLSGANTYTGATSINAGTVSISAIGNLGSGTALNIDNGALLFTAPVDISAKTVTMSNTATYNVPSGVTNTFANGVGNNGNGQLVKTGAGTLILQGNNTYTGGTVINNGLLTASNTTGSATGSNAVAVNATGALGGTGTISGAVTVNSGGNLSPGASVGTLTVGSLTLQSGSTGTWEFSGSANDVVVVSNSGGLTLNGGAIAAVAENSGNAPFSNPGSYNLIKYTGAVGGGTSNLSVSNPQPGKTYAFALSGGYVTLNVGVAAVFSNWTNAAGGDWNTSGNWSNGIPNGVSQTANFNTDLTGGAGSVLLNGSKTLGAAIFQSAASSYTINQGSGGTLTLNNGTAQSGLSVLAGNHTIAVPIVVAGSGGVVADTIVNTSLTLSNTISGVGPLHKNGAGAVVLTGSNSFSGDVQLNNGTLGIGHNNALSGGNLNVNASAALRADANNLVLANNISVGGAATGTVDSGLNTLQLNGFIDGGGTFNKAGNGTVILNNANSLQTGQALVSAGTLVLGTGSGANGALGGTLTNNSVVVLNHSTAENFGNAVSGTGMFVKAGTNVATFTTGMPYTGDTRVAGGTLVLGDSTAIQNSSLDYNNYGGTISFGGNVAATIGGLKGAQNLSLLNDSATAVALMVGNSGQNTAYSGVLSGTGSTLIKVGAGTLTLSNVQAHTGGTQLGTSTQNGGILELATGADISSAPLTFGSVGGSRLLISGGQYNTLGLVDTLQANGIVVSAGTLSAGGLIQNITSQTQNYLFQVSGGQVNLGTYSAGRLAIATLTTESVAGQTDIGLIVTAGTLNVANTFNMGNRYNANSSLNMRMDGGLVNIGGAATLSNNHGARWATIDVNGGTLNITAPEGLTMGGGANPNTTFNYYTNGNNIVLVRNGVANISKIQMGALDVLGTVSVTDTNAATYGYTGTQVLGLYGGALYMGAGGIVDVGEVSAGTNTIRTTNIIRMGTATAGGILGANADWSSRQNIDLRNNTALSVIKAADAAGTAHNITLSGIASGTGGFNKTGAGTLTLSGANTYTGITTVSQGTLYLAPASQGPILAGTGTTGGAALNGGKLVMQYSGTSPKAEVVDDAVDGLAVNAATNFVAGTVRTSLAADSTKAIGWLDDGSSIFQARYTYKGDIDLSGVVDSTDFNAFVAPGNYGMTSGAIWAQGDSNYDGKVNTIDFNHLAGNFGLAAFGAPLPGGTLGGSPSLGAVVPEPSTLGLVGIGSMAMIARRRRNAR